MNFLVYRQNSYILESYFFTMKLIYSFLICLISFTSFSQRGKNGSVIISTTNSVVNVYTPLTLNATIGSKTITVLNSASYTVGDLVFIIQMQGAVVNAGKDSLYPDVNSAIPTNTTFGAVTNYYNSGKNEYAEIYAVPNSTTIVLDCGLKYNYDYLIMECMKLYLPTLTIYFLINITFKTKLIKNINLHYRRFYLLNFSILLKKKLLTI